MKAVYAGAGCNFQQIKDLGFDTVIGEFPDSDLHKMFDLGIGCISSVFVDHPAVIAYYLFDEPDVNKVPISDQDAKIAWFRARTNKPLAIACIEEVERLCSPSFDWYMMDIYYSAKISKLKNYLNAAVSPHFLQVLYPGKKLIPIMGLYDDQGPFLFTPEMYPFARWFRSFFKTDDQAVFWLQGDGVASRGILDRTEYQTWARALNSTKDRRCWVTGAALFAAAWLVIKINPLLGKYKIKIG